MRKLLLLVCMMTLTSCASSSPPTPSPSTSVSTTTVPSSTSTTATTTPSPSTTSVPTSLSPGVSGPQVTALQQSLSAHHFWVGSVDGNYGTLTSQAVLAVQKYFGLSRTGIFDSTTATKLASINTPALPSFGTPDGFTIDLSHQLLYYAQEGKVVWVFHTSTGKPSTPTVKGTFHTYRQVDAWDPGPNGALYRPKYFTGGYAIHGLASVPSYPASHGCARVNESAMDFIWSQNLDPVGTTVVVQ